MPKEYDTIRINGAPLPNMFVLPPWATLKDITPADRTRAMGDADEALAPFGYTLNRAALEALESKR